MGLFSGLVLLPLAPVRGVVWLAEQVQEQAERQLYDPQRIVRLLEEVAEARDAGEISEEEAARQEEELVNLLAEGSRRR
ncbi:MULTISPECIES: gas vesicle protein GvpG [Actinoallomurus]|uniref:gas vesicle protein GvpG n=1 Tax=Actinoallomurus TaxID=667113 RepID=UPI002091EDE7|nr:MULTISPECIES: gas vesicle protein GvpG [Actinoallomurus]MCO5967586.1 gas vesicle protein GvpG [Actinoallomurus soli]MCO5997187.1 gas vesicle protein GvpG [Actinoallomurus rhizosphaericola]